MSKKVKKAHKVLLAFSGLIIGAVSGWFTRSDNANFHTVEEFKIAPYFTDTANADYKPLPPPSPGCGGGGGDYCDSVDPILLGGGDFYDAGGVNTNTDGDANDPGGLYDAGGVSAGGDADGDVGDLGAGGDFNCGSDDDGYGYSCAGSSDDDSGDGGSGNGGGSDDDGGPDAGCCGF